VRVPTLPTVVMVTRNRRERVLATLRAVTALPERPEIVLVDNASTDGTAAAVGCDFPGVTVVPGGAEIGSAARTLGVKAARTPLVAFTDDDSWWEPGALPRAAAHFAAHPHLGLLAAHIIVEPDGRLDPTCEAMRHSPLPAPMPLPGPPVLGFVACGAIGRRSAVLECGGFHRRYGFGGEEELLAVDLATAGWGLAYVDDVVAHHEPRRGSHSERAVSEVRNRLWSIWLRRPLLRAARLTLRDGAPAGLAAAARGLPWVLRERRVVPAHVESALQLLD
jgi:N-acetylglucosaminyl-diphospho-decaprenol L-rhamnosyltransferase